MRLESHRRVRGRRRRCKVSDQAVKVGEGCSDSSRASESEVRFGQGTEFVMLGGTSMLAR